MAEPLNIPSYKPSQSFLDALSFNRQQFEYTNEAPPSANSPTPALDYDPSTGDSSIPSDARHTSLKNFFSGISSGAKTAYDRTFLIYQPYFNLLGAASNELSRRVLYPSMLAAGAVGRSLSDSIAKEIVARRYSSFHNPYNKNLPYGYFEAYNLVNSVSSDPDKPFFDDISRNALKTAASEVLFPYSPGVNDEGSSFLERLKNHSDYKKYSNWLTPGTYFGSFAPGFSYSGHFNKLLDIDPSSAASTQSKFLFPLTGLALDLAIQSKLGAHFNTLTPAGFASEPSRLNPSSWAEQARAGQRALFDIPILGKKFRYIKGQRVFDSLSNLNKRINDYDAARFALKNYDKLTAYLADSPFERIAFGDIPSKDFYSSVVHNTPFAVRAISRPYGFTKRLFNFYDTDRLLRLSADASLHDSDLFSEFANAAPSSSPFFAFDTAGRPFRVFSDEVGPLSSIAKSLSKFSAPEDFIHSLYMSAYTPKVGVRNVLNSFGQSINSGANPLDPRWIRRYFGSLSKLGSTESAEFADKVFRRNNIFSLASLPASSSSELPLINRLARYYSWLNKKFLKGSAHFEQAARTATSSYLTDVLGYNPYRAAFSVNRNFVPYFLPSSLENRAAGMVLPFSSFYFGNRLNNLRMAVSDPYHYHLPRYLQRALILSQTNSDDNDDPQNRNLYPPLPSYYFDNPYGFSAPIPSTKLVFNFKSLFPQLSGSASFDDIKGRALMPWLSAIELGKDFFTYDPKEHFPFHQGDSPFGLFKPKNPAQSRWLDTLTKALKINPLLYDIHKFATSFSPEVYSARFGKHATPNKDLLLSYLGVKQRRDPLSFFASFKEPLHSYIEQEHPTNPVYQQLFDLIDELTVRRSLRPSTLGEHGEYLPGNDINNFFLRGVYDNGVERHLPSLYKSVYGKDAPVTWLGAAAHDSGFNYHRRQYVSPTFESFLYNYPQGLFPRQARLSGFSLVPAKSNEPDSSVSSQSDPVWPSDPSEQDNALNKLFSSGRLFNEFPVFYYHPSHTSDPDPFFTGSIDFLTFNYDEDGNPISANIADMKAGENEVATGSSILSDPNGQLTLYALSLMQMFPTLRDVTAFIHQQGQVHNSPLHFKNDASAFTSANRNFDLDRLYSELQASISKYRSRDALYKLIYELLYNNPTVLPRIDAYRNSLFYTPSKLPYNADRISGDVTQ